MTNLAHSALLLALPLAACATLQHGTVEKRLDNNAARVYLGSKDLVVTGQRVGIYARVCEQRFRDGIDIYDDVCEDRRVGSGTITQVLGPDVSLVRVDPGVTYGYGMVVKPESLPAH